MSLADSLYRPLDPFSMHIAWSIWTVSQADEVWGLRPFWVIEDLRLIYDWLNQPGARYNRSIYALGFPLIQHYMNRLESDNSQSFMLLRNRSVIGSFDLVRAENDQISRYIQIMGNEGVVHYIFPAERIRNLFWMVGVEGLRSLFLRYYPGVPLYIDAPESSMTICNQIEELGFKQCAQYQHHKQILNLYVYR